MRSRAVIRAVLLPVSSLLLDHASSLLRLEHAHTGPSSALLYLHQ